jgi:hypothetical protein
MNVGRPEFTTYLPTVDPPMQPGLKRTLAPDNRVWGLLLPGKAAAAGSSEDNDI